MASQPALSDLYSLFFCHSASCLGRPGLTRNSKNHKVASMNVRTGADMGVF